MKFWVSLCLIANFLWAYDDIQGFWKTISEEGEAQSIIAIYEYEGLRYGRIIASFNENGKIDDSIYKPVKKSSLPGNPYYSGLDIIWFLEDAGTKFKGKILDPRNGDVYKAELWTQGSNHLVVRGKLLIFGRSQTWFAVTKKDLPSGFKLPDLKTFVPSIPDL